MTSMHDELLTLFDRMNTHQQQKLLEMARQILHPPRAYTGQELMALPREERERLVAEARSTQERAALSVEPEMDQSQNQTLKNKT